MRVTHVGLALLPLLAALALAACGGGSDDQSEAQTNGGQAGAEETFVLKLGDVTTSDHPWNVAARQLADAVEQESNGRLKIEIHDNGTLGSEVDLIQQLQLGDLDIGIVGGSTHSNLVPAMGIENLPFAFASHDEAYRAYDGELGDKLLALLEEKGIKGLAWWEDGLFQITNSKRPIKTPADLNGLKIRVPEVPLRLDAFKALGANPVPMAFTELFTALQQGTVDGQENPLVVIDSSKFDEVQKYVSLTNMTWGSAVFEVAMSTWERLPADLQEILERNAVKYRDVERDLVKQGDEKLVPTLEEKGMQVNEIADVAPFRDAVASVYEKYEPEFGADLIDTLRKYQQGS